MTREQFIQQVEATQEALRRFFVALCCGDSQQADDLAQEALIKAWVSCETLREPAKFRAWIFRIAYNTFISSQRSQPTLSSLDDSEAADTPSDYTADNAFNYQALYSALDALPPKERSSVLLFYMEGYSIKEIVELTGSSEAAVKQHLSRGRIHLRALLSNP